LERVIEIQERLGITLTIICSVEWKSPLNLVSKYESTYFSCLNFGENLGKG